MAMIMSATFAFGQNTSSTGNTGNDVNNNGSLQNATKLNVTAIVGGATKVKISLTWHNDAGSIEPCYSDAAQTQYATWISGNTWTCPSYFEAPTNCFLPNNGGARVTWMTVATDDIQYPPKVVNYGCGTFYIVPGSTTNSLTIQGSSDWNKCMDGGTGGTGGTDN